MRGRIQTYRRKELKKSCKIIDEWVYRAKNTENDKLLIDICIENPNFYHLIREVFEIITDYDDALYWLIVCIKRGLNPYRYILEYKQAIDKTGYE